MSSGKSNPKSISSILDDFRVGAAPLGSQNLSGLVSLAIVAACSIFVLVVMNPQLIVSDTIPTGGDMGAHVWGPAYLRDELLPNLRLTGWSPDWYAGFPAYQFYMVVPALAIVALNAGINPWIGIPASIFAVAAIVKAGRWFGIRTRYIVALSAIVTTLQISLPYGVAFKIVTVIGLVFFPLSVWFLARMARAPEPVPAFLALGGTVFLFDASFWILGGNIMSTLAGEFSFSISLTLSFFAMGLVIRGMDRGDLRARSALIIGLVALCHIIPLFFMVLMLAFILLLGRDTPRYPLVALVAVVSTLLFVTGPNTASPLSFLKGDAGGGAATWSTFAALVVIVIGTLMVAAAVSQSEEIRSRAWWLITAGGVAALLAMFWLLPFWYQGSHFNDMGWTRLTEIGPKVLTTPMKVCLPIAAVGAVTSFISRDRIGMLFTSSAVVSLSAVANLPQGALWNERILPFFYLSIYLLTAIAVAGWVRAVAVWKDQDFERPNSWVLVSGSLVGFVVLLVGVSMPLRTLPFGQEQADGSYTWGVFKSTERTKVPGWSQWNYAGYEGRSSYGEYHHVVSTMDELGKSVASDGSDGCGRAMWEFDDSLDRYGTPMALMLLPYWTDGCIGSMEGLFFESSATTPFHFLNQSTLSQEPSRAQRDLPYDNFDIDVGVAQLQTMGVRYYMALTDASIEAARAHDDLTEVADAAPFVVFEVSNSELVESLEYDPVVISESDGVVAQPVDGIEPVEVTRFDTGWLSQAVEYYGDPAGYQALPAEDGPEDWQVRSALAEADATKRSPVTVSNIEMGQNSVSFDVDNVNSPVLVKVSHFPNWKVSGAEGPFRAGPNLMVVIPTSENVSLSYGRNFIDWFSILLTITGFAGVYMLIQLDRTRRRTNAVPAGVSFPAPESNLEHDQPQPVIEDMADETHPEPVVEEVFATATESATNEATVLRAEDLAGVSPAEDIANHTDEHCGEGWLELGGFCGGEDDEEDPEASDQAEESSRSGLDPEASDQAEESSRSGLDPEADTGPESKKLLAEASEEISATEVEPDAAVHTDEHCGEGWDELGFLDIAGSNQSDKEGSDKISDDSGPEGLGVG